MTNKKQKYRLLKWFGFGALFVAISSTAIALPIVINNNKKTTLDFNHSTNTYEGNKNRINYFIDEILQPNYYNLSGSLKVMGDENVIGKKDVELTSNERSMITVEEANKNGMFRFAIEPTFSYSMKQNKIKWELAYIRPYYSDSTYPLVGIKLFYGSGINYYETIYEYRDTSLYGFSKIPEQIMMDSYIQDISENPNQYFTLKKDVGIIGEIGLYAKNIKISDFDLANNKLNELRKNNYWVSITNINVDVNNPTQLKIIYNIRYEGNGIISYTTNREVVLGDFDIEQGIDDPKSKLKNFIKLNEDWINNLSQHFVFNNPDNKEYTVREAYEAGLIELKTNYSIQSKLNSDGIKLEFKQFSQENSNELSAFNYEFDSTTPMYRVYLTSYADTPLAYTESVLVEGTSQEGEFKMSQEEKDMNTFNDYLEENNLFLDEIFNINWTNLDPLSLLSNDGYFKDKGVIYDVNSKKYNIPFNIVNKLYEKYNEDQSIVKTPFSVFEFSLIKGDLPSNIQEIANQILKTINNQKKFELQLDSINSKELFMNFNVSLASKDNTSLYTNIDFLEISVSNHFVTQDEYNDSILDQVVDWTKGNLKNIEILLNESKGILNKEKINELILNRNFGDIFSTANIYNIPSDKLKFPELQSELKVEIDLNYFLTLSHGDLETIVNSGNISIQILISLDDSQRSFIISTTIDKLLEDNKNN